MRIRNAAVALFIGCLTATAAMADSVTATTRSDGTVVVDGKPCRVVTTKDDSGKNQTSITAGPGGVSGSTSVSPGGSGSSSSVSVGSGAGDGHSSSASTSDCVIYRREAK